MLRFKLQLLVLSFMTLTGCAVTPESPVVVAEPVKIEKEAAQVSVYQAPPTIIASVMDTTVDDAEAPKVRRKEEPTPKVSPVKNANSRTSKPPVKKPVKPTSTTASLDASKVPSQAASGTSVPVNALLKQSEAQQSSGDLVRAAATLERGLRIAPRNPQLWTRLARIRLKQNIKNYMNFRVRMNQC